MITVITGQPGAGKTALAVSMLLEEQGSRPLFVMGIPDLLIPHEKTPPIAEWTTHVASEEDPTITRPVFTFPDNAIILIDEAQNVYRPRGATSKVPDHVAAFETHRHTGVDFWLITQNPSLLDNNIRKLAGRHVDIKTNALGIQTLFEWTQCVDPDSSSALRVAVTRSYKPPKKVFGLYKSATRHLKHKRRIPKQIYVVAAVILTLVGGGWYLYRNVTSRIDPPVSSDASQPLAQTSLNSARFKEGGGLQPVEGFATLVQPSLPRIVNQPETAPMYDGMRSVTNVPRIAGCIVNSTKCTCFTDQATVYPADDKTCRDYIKNPPFDPYTVRSASPPPVAAALAPDRNRPDPADDATAEVDSYSVPDTTGKPNLMVTPERIF
ncbi:zonular occludens toxin domain-containing protein [Vogesella sp. LYT5W]|uniref:Zonular occludens toxin domain-containing protein n=1 Tax=Vogesella margarita TaxID=2984199 RepID=A0ABT5ISH1_9NEIS|nr:zonular occludens toxin domain-containing protein [Vogesella margarita]MDC7715143.1 zonular occludens toxin domain-containing protein [Vogesella margarita]